MQQERSHQAPALLTQHGEGRAREGGERDRPDDLPEDRDLAATFEGNTLLRGER